MSHEADPMPLPLLRASLSAEYSEADYTRLTQIVEAVYGEGVAPEDVEGLFRDIGRGLSQAARSVGGFVQQAAPMVARALPNIAQGAASGAAFGPWGALAGAVAGGASGIMQQSSDPTVRGIGGAIHQVGSLASSIRGGGLGGGGNMLGSLATGGQGGAGGAPNLLASIFGGGGAGPGGGALPPTPAATGSAANGLMGMLTRPETLQALLSAGMGAFGNRNLQIGGQAVPVHSLLSALSGMAGRAASEAAEYADNAHETPGYILSAGESLGINPESSEGRIDATTLLLAMTPSIWAAQRPAGPPLTVNVGQPDPFAFAAMPMGVPAPAWTFESSESAEGADAWPEWAEWPEIEWGETLEMTDV